MLNYRSAVFLISVLFLTITAVTGALACDSSDIKMEGDTELRNSFDVDLYSRLASKDTGNICFSPFSIHSALSMVYEGAEGRTAWQMEQVLGLTVSDDQRHPMIKELMEVMQKDSPDLEVRIANSLWSMPEYPVEESFLSVLEETYHSELRETDFFLYPVKSAEKINSWVEDRTSGRIKDLFGKDSFDSMTRLVLVNAVYFRGDWAKPFDPSKTEKGVFKTVTENIPGIPFMKKTERWNYYSDNDIQALDMPYAEGNYSLLVISPRETAGLEKVGKDISGEYISSIRKSMRPERVSLSFPKFEMKDRFQVAEILEDLGMTHVFSPVESDLSGISSGEKLYLSEVVHASFFRIDEKGTEAAAATGTGIKAASIPAEPVKMTLDHPFMFILYHEEINTILFMGRVADPS